MVDRRPSNYPKWLADIVKRSCGPLWTQTRLRHSPPVDYSHCELEFQLSQEPIQAHAKYRSLSVVVIGWTFGKRRMAAIGTKQAL